MCTISYNSENYLINKFEKYFSDLLKLNRRLGVTTEETATTK